MSTRSTGIIRNSAFLSFTCALLSGQATATVVASANFTGMTATAVTTVGPSVGANDFTWSLIQTPLTTLSIVTDDGSPGIGGGNALRMETGGTGTFRGVTASLASAITVDIGATITLSLSGRYYEALGNNSGGMRFGLIAPGDVDNNFFAQFGTGGSTAFGLFRDIDNDNTPGSGTGVVGISSTASGSAHASLSTLNPFTAVLSVTRTGSSVYEISATLNGATRTGSSTTGWNSFNGLFIRNGGITSDYLIDDVSVSLIPEPTAPLLCGLGVFAFLRRRRS